MIFVGAEFVLRGAIVDEVRGGRNVVVISGNFPGVVGVLAADDMVLRYVARPRLR